jgi:hypothetical protein
MRDAFETASCPDEGEEMTGQDPTKQKKKATLDNRVYRDDESSPKPE